MTASSLEVAQLLHRAKLVSWDVDGTLYSLRRFKRQVALLWLEEVLRRRHLLAHREIAILRRHHRRIERARWTGGVLADRPTPAEQALLDRLAPYWYGRAIARSGPLAGVRMVLGHLRLSAVPQVVLSDYRADYKLAALDVGWAFAATYIGEDLGRVKPNPAGFHSMAADFGVSAGEILHFGDRVATDAAAADAVGCRALILGRDFRDYLAVLAQLQGG